MTTQSSQVLIETHQLVAATATATATAASGRAEIDTSAPFESVKEAANLFGGMGFWKPISHHKTCQNEEENVPDDHEQHGGEIIGIVQMEEQAAQLERDLIIKEREALNVIKELETTKNIVEELKLKLQRRQVFGINEALKENPDDNEDFVDQLPEDRRPEIEKTAHPNECGGLDLCASAPGFFLQELKQAKLNLTRTTNDLADIRATVDLYNKRIEKERMLLEKTRQRWSSNASKISCPEVKPNQAKQEQVGLTDADVQGSHNHPMNITRELQKLSSDTEQIKKVGEAAKSQVLRATSEIEQTKTRIRNAEIRLIAAKRMKEAAKASEAVALADIKALSKGEKKGTASQKKLGDVTLTFEEYSSLISKVREAEKSCDGAMLQVDEANLSKTEILKRVAEATEEVKTSKKALEEVLSRVEAATRGKLEVEDALRMWRSNHGHKRRSSRNSARFKNSHPSAHWKESHLLLDSNGLNLANDELKPVPKPTLCIGQILSRKLLLSEGYENGIQPESITGKHKVSLGQMLRRRSADLHSTKIPGKENCELPAKRNKFGLVGIPLLGAKQSKKKRI